LRGLLDRFADADISAAAANVAGHRSIDIGIVRTRIVRQQSGRGHERIGDAEADTAAPAAIATRDWQKRGDRNYGKRASSAPFFAAR
jgi:hypothetical protein